LADALTKVEQLSQDLGVARTRAADTERDLIEALAEKTQLEQGLPLSLSLSLSLSD
jgi:hypothetical protein